jgi:hypothetical protein
MKVKIHPNDELSVSMHRFIESFLPNLIGEYNDSKTRDFVQNVLQLSLAYFENDSRWRVLCDESNNTPEVIDNNEIIVSLLSPTENEYRVIFLPSKIEI